MFLLLKIVLHPKPPFYQALFTLPTDEIHTHLDIEAVSLCIIKPSWLDMYMMLSNRAETLVQIYKSPNHKMFRAYHSTSLSADHASITGFLLTS